MAVQLLSKAAYARHRGCDEKAVRKAIAERRISLIDGKIDPEVADIQWAKNTRARADSKRTEPSLPLDGGSTSTAPESPANGPESAPLCLAILTIEPSAKKRKPKWHSAQT